MRWWTIGGSGGCRWNVKFPLGKDSFGSIKMGLSGGVWIGRKGGIGEGFRTSEHLLAFGGLFISGVARPKPLGEVLEFGAGVGISVGVFCG